ncbi:MAG: restriction endonuclease subunit S [Bacteroidaceae bacterium]|nr:restriction endonuclease subunit S [Bacteroidaceae bacterium]
MMEEWKKYKLGEICTKIGSGATPKGGKEAYLGGATSLIRSQNVLDFAFSWEGLAYINDEQATKLNGVEVKKNDVLLNITGDSVARVCIVPDSALPARVNQHVSIVRGNKSKVLNEYILYFLQFKKQHLLSLAQGGATRNALTKGMIEDFTIPLPQLEEQDRIVSILSSLDSKIEINRRINVNLEQQAQALFKSWFVDFEPFKDGEFVESELGRIPKGWRVGTLDELCSFISRGLTPKYDETSEELILGQTCVRNNIVTLNNARKHRPKTKNDKWVQQWDVLLNSTGIGSLGRVGIVYFNMDNVAIDSHITVVRTSCPLYRHYVGRNLLSRQLEIENMAVGSTGQTELPRDRVKAMPIVIPSHEAMDKFNAIIEPTAISMYSNIIESRRLSTLRDTLLPRLMSGELHVKDIERSAI